MTIQPIVEGFGEVEAIPVLLRRLRDISGVFDLEFAPPIRGRWFLASLRSLRGSRGIRDDAETHPDPESVRGAKERLTGCMEPGRTYSETRDQAALSALVDLAAAYRSCRSFRRLVRAFGIVASGAGASLREWPPSSWIAGP